MFVGANLEYSWWISEYKMLSACFEKFSDSRCIVLITLLILLLEIIERVSVDAGTFLPVFMIFFYFK